MVAFARAIKDPEKYVGYTPVNDIAEAYKERWINTIQFFVDSDAVKELFLDGYVALDLLKGTPVVATEWQAMPHQAGTMKKSLTDFENFRMANATKMFWGVSLFEYSVSYQKGGPERGFGLLGFGKEIIGETLPMYAANPGGPPTYDPAHAINCLTIKDPSYLKEVTDVWGGSAPTHGMCISTSIGAVTLV